LLTLVIGVLLPWVIVGAGCWVGFQFLRQNGRILLRLERLEREVASLSALAQAARGASQPQRAEATPPRGLTPGGAAPAFELTDLAGGRASLRQFRGRRVLLVFFNPRCGFCVQMAPALAALPIDGSGGRPIPLVITTGNAQETRRLVREHNIRAPVLLQRQNEVAQAYQASGTPTGYLVDEHGRIASPIGIGAQQVLALARDGGEAAPAAKSPASANGNGQQTHRGNRPLTASRIKRDGLRAGTPAPDFKLPSVDGGELSLSDYRGRQVLLVFSDPHCGPCTRLAPRLEQLAREQPDVAVLMVSRGDAGENRKKVAELGLKFPVVLQKQWEVSRAYAMFATPIGYLIDESGVVATDVALGAEAILALPARASAPTI
jgi:peroxiredoxin